MVSQSGNLGTQLLVAAERRRGGVGKFVGVGNEAMIDAVDFINYLRTDPQTSTIVAYMEGFDDGRRLLDVVRRTSGEKPVVVLRGGLTDYGAKAAASHTGALTSSSAVFSAAARQSGMIVTTDPDEFMDLTFALAYMPLPPGTRIAVATMDGEFYVVDADGSVLDRYGARHKSLDGPIVKGLINVARENAREDNQERMSAYLAVIADFKTAPEDLLTHISEIDVGNPRKVALIPTDEPVPIFVGNQAFLRRYQTFLENRETYDELKRQYGTIEYVDVTFEDKIIFHTPQNQQALMRNEAQF
jgi:hypothetical protein